MPNACCMALPDYLAGLIGQPCKGPHYLGQLVRREAVKQRQ